MIKKQIIFIVLAAVMALNAYAVNPPVIYDVYPGTEFFTSEASLSIKLYIYDDASVDAGKIVFEYNGATYKTVNANVSWVAPVLTFNHPTGGSYAEGAHCIRLIDCQDSGGTQVENLPYQINFTVDTVQPSITGLDPADAQNDVQEGSALALYFSEGIDTDSAGKAVRVYENGTEISKGLLQFSDNDKIVVLEPVLKRGRTYQVKIRTSVADTSNSLTDKAGNILTDDDSTPGDGYYCYTFQMEDSDKPVVKAINPELSSAVEDDERLTVIFSKSMDYSTMENRIRIYDPALNPVDLYLENGTDKDRINIVLNEPLLSGITYELFMADTISDIYGITLEDTGDDNAVNTSYEKYFQLNSPLPAVQSTLPADGTTDVSTTSALNICFNKKMDPSTLIQSSISMLPAKIIRSIDWKDTQTAVIGFEGELLEKTLYTVSIRKNGLKDYYGKEFASDYSFSFTTASGTARVLSTIPVPGAGDVAVDSTLQVFFNRNPSNALKKSTWLTVTEVNSGRTVYGEIGVAGNTVTFRPQNSIGGYIDFLDYTEYQVSVNSVEFEDGTVYSGTCDYTFITGDSTAPSVSAISPVAGSRIRDNESIYIYFSEKMNNGSVEKNLKINQAVKELKWDSESSGTRLEIILNPLFHDSTCLTIETGAADLSGKVMAARYTVTYTNVNIKEIELVNSYPSSEESSIVRSQFYCRLHFNAEFDPSEIIQSAQIIGTGTESSSVIKFDSYLVSALDSRIITLYLADPTRMTENRKYVVNIPAGTVFSDGLILSNDINLPFTAAKDSSLLQGAVFKMTSLVDSYFITLHDGHYNLDTSVPQFYLVNADGTKRSITLRGKMINDRKIYYGFMIKNKSEIKVLVTKGTYTEEMGLY